MKYTKIFIAILLVLSSLLLSSCAALPKDLFFEDNGSTTSTDKAPGTTTTPSGDTPAATTATGSISSGLPKQFDESLCKVSTNDHGVKRYYVDEGIPMYNTIDGVTYFYVKYYVPAYPFVCVRFHVDRYQNFFPRLRYSNDGKNWSIIPTATGDVPWKDDGGVSYNDATTGYCYISYMAITDCPDPDAFLTILIENVYSNPDLYSVIIDSAAG